MERRNFLLSIPLIGSVVNALAKQEEPKPEKEAFKESEDGNVLVWDQNEQGFKELKAEIRGRTVIFKKDDDGKFSVMDPDTGSTVKGNLLWTDEYEIKLE